MQAFATAPPSPALLPFSGPRPVPLRLAATPAQRREIRRFLGRVNFAVSAAARRGWCFNADSQRDLRWCYGEDLRRLRFSSDLSRDVFAAAARHLKAGLGFPDKLPPDSPFRLSSRLYTVSRGCVGVRVGSGWLHCPVEDPDALGGMVVLREQRAELRPDGDGFVLEVPATPVVGPRFVPPGGGDPADDRARFVFQADVLLT
ncbi:MAG: hypothetical protein BGO49_00545 [Planctomycetales bacterium 71-10]|nr:MAG: hypothetical protein BGO49_00545 [Planctomycetales bacterium 71-10]